MVTNETSRLNEWRLKVVKWLFLATGVFSLYLTLFSAYVIYQYTQNGYTMTDLKPLFVQSGGNVLILIISAVSFFLYRRKVDLFIWIFPIMFVIWLGFDISQSLWTYIVIPIIMAALIIRPVTSFIFALIYCSEVIVILYMNQSLPKDVNSAVTGLLPVFVIQFIFALVAYFVGRELFKILENKNAHVALPSQDA